MTRGDFAGTMREYLDRECAGHTPADAMQRVAEFYARYAALGPVRWVAYPAAYDWQWLRFYWDQYIGDERLTYTATCASTLARHVTCRDPWAEAQQTFDRAGYVRVPHDALSDAEWQAAIYHATRECLRDMSKPA